jgi:hypothetical protein
MAIKVKNDISPFKYYSFELSFRVHIINFNSVHPLNVRAGRKSQLRIDLFSGVRCETDSIHSTCHSCYTANIKGNIVSDLVYCRCVTHLKEDSYYTWLPLVVFDLDPFLTSFVVSYNLKQGKTSYEKNKFASLAELREQPPQKSASQCTDNAYPCFIHK